MHSDYFMTRISDEQKGGMLAYFDLWTESPGGGKVLYFQFDGPVPGPGQVVVCDPDGGSPRVIGRSSFGHPHTASRQLWLDDDTVAFNRPGAMGPESVVFSLSTGRSRVLSGAIRTYSESRGLGVYSSHDWRNYNLAPAEEAVYLLDLASGQSRRLFDRQDVLNVFPQRQDVFRVEEMNFKHTKWSPDGSRFFCVFNNEMAVRADPRPERVRLKWLVVAEADGSNLRCLCKGGGHPMWTPDGQAIFMYAGGCQAHPLDGGASRLLHRGPGVHASISPDGRRLVTDAFDYPAPGQAAVLLYSLGADTPVVLAVLEKGELSRTSETHPHPVWSRDGRRVYFNSMDSGIRQLHAVEVPA